MGKKLITPVFEYPPPEMLELILVGLGDNWEMAAFVPWVRLREDVRLSLALGVSRLNTMCWCCARDDRAVRVSVEPKSFKLKELGVVWSGMLGQCPECGAMLWGDERKDGPKKRLTKKAINDAAAAFGLLPDDVNEARDSGTLSIGSAPNGELVPDDKLKSVDEYRREREEKRRDQETAAAKVETESVLKIALKLRANLFLSTDETNLLNQLKERHRVEEAPAEDIAGGD